MTVTAAAAVSAVGMPSLLGGIAYADAEAAGEVNLKDVLGGRKLGIVIHSYWKRWLGQYSSVKTPPFLDALDALDHVRSHAVSVLQIPVAGWTSDLAKQLRSSGESYDVRLEGSVEMPRHEKDVGRFERELRIGKEAGVEVFRAYLGGRRYEDFASRGEFEVWKGQAMQALDLAEPVARRLKVVLAVENHKDWETEELVSALRRFESSHLGACLDLGNNVALLEAPMETLRKLLPYVKTVHVKDMAVKEQKEGFLLAEVPLGKGVLPLPQMLVALVQAQPRVSLNLEMITRDPLLVPCLTEGYWASFAAKSGLDLVRTLNWVREHEAKELLRVAALSTEAWLALEEKNIQDSFAHARVAWGMNHPPPYRRGEG